MSRLKEQVLDAIGGFRLDEVQTGSSPRIREIQALDNKLRSGVSLDEVENVIEQMRKLKGLPPDEFDYEARD